jgi:hypothetical protein
MRAEMLRKYPAERFAVGRVLQHPGALEVLIAVQPGGQQKMAFKQGAGFFENGQDAIGVHGFLYERG